MERRWGAVSICLAVMLAGAATASAATWTPPLTLSKSGLPASDAILAVDAAGDAVVLWGSGGGSESSYRPAGGTWGKPVQAVGGGETQLAISPHGKVVAAWKEEPQVLGSPSTIEAAFLGVDGTWQMPTVISPKTERSLEPSVAIGANGVAVVAWTSVESTEQARIQAAAGSASNDWGEPFKASPSGENNGEASVGIDGEDRAVVGWRHGNGAKDTVEVGYRSAGGVWADPPVTIPASTDGVYEPRVGVDDAGDVTAIWADDEGLKSHVEASTQPAGGSFGEARPISSTGELSDYLGLDVAPSGAAGATWVPVGESSSSLSAAVVTAPAPGEWGASVTASPSSIEDAEYPAIAVADSGEAAVAWSAHLGEGHYAIEASTSLPGGGWEGPTTLSGGTYSYGVSLGSDAAGDLTAAWTEDLGPKAKVVVAERAAPPPANPPAVPAGGAGVKPIAPPAPGPAACHVPRLRKKAVAEARRVIHTRDCGVRVKHRHSHLAKGRVIRQKPGPGKVTAAGANIVVTVSSGPRRPRHPR